MTTAVELARREWEDAHRQLEQSARDRVQYVALLEQVEVVTAGLRQHVGQTFTLEELAAAYSAADRWARDLVAERAAAPGWPRTLAIVEGAAFHLYARGAIDYEP